MQVPAQQVFKEIESGQTRPFYLVVGEEPFQAQEILTRISGHFIKSEEDRSFNYESWDAEQIDVGALRTSLETLPGLFSEATSTRLVVCRNFEKLNATQIDVLDSYFKNPSDSTCFLIFAAKVDRRKSWYKSLDEKGQVIEVSDPYDREWPKWLGFFERRLGKRIEPPAWENLVERSSKRLAILCSELEKLATFVGDRKTITLEDVRGVVSSSGEGDIFAFAEQVVCRRAFPALRDYQVLLGNGESEIKILSILVRQFRLVENYLKLGKKGITDSKALGSQLGVHSYFVSKIAQQAKFHTADGLQSIIRLLAEADFRLKIGESKLFAAFLMPYFASFSKK